MLAHYTISKFYVSNYPVVHEKKKKKSLRVTERFQFQQRCLIICPRADIRDEKQAY